jgi:TrkA domain protein
VIEVRETRLPGVGKKFTMRTHLGEDVCAVVHIDGRRELYHRPDPDEDSNAVIVLNDEEAHELGSILGGVVYQPELLDKLEIVLKDLAIDWIDIPETSPIVGLTVATCRIRTTTGGTIVAIIRPEGAIAMPHPDEVIRPRDTLVVITTPETFEALKRLVAEGPAPDAG